MRYVLLVIIIFHGLIHILGFIKAFNLAEIDQLSGAISKPIGILWLITTILFILTAILFVTGKDYWWIAGSTAAIILQILIISSLHDAKFGTIANLILLLPLIIAYADSQPVSYKNLFKVDVEIGLNQYTKQDILT